MSEAEALAWSGVDNVLVTNEIVGKGKLARLAALACICRIGVCADDPSQVDAIEAAAAAAGVRLEVCVEINAGGNRCGVMPGAPAMALARQIAGAPHLTFGGIQAYHGNAQHRRTVNERREAATVAWDAARKTRDLLRANGIACPVITGAGTGTFELDAESGVITELQCGSYLFMDVDYSQNLDATGVPVSMFRQSLFVLASVMSVAVPGIAVLDAGHKAVAVDSGLPVVWKRADLEYIGASDEHGKLRIAPGAAVPRLGEKLRLVPGHCDPTIDRYDWYVGVRAGRVECLWPIAARGAMA